MTLLELLVVLLVMALLLVVALPGYQRWLLQSRRALAWSELLQVQARQDQFYLATGAYTHSLSELGYPGDAYTIDAWGTRRVPGAGTAIYRMEQRLQDADILIRARVLPAGADTECPLLQLAVQTNAATRPPACR